jgi:integrase
MRVYVERDRSRLRVRVIYQGKKYQFSTGLADTKTNRAYVQGVTRRIELDMASGHFDATLLKYRPQVVGSNPSALSCPDLFKHFTEYQFKKKGLASGSVRRYQPIQSCLEQRLNIPAHQVGERLAGNYAALLLERLTARTAKERLWMLAACWNWAQGRYHVAEDNPWTAQVQRIKPPPQQGVKPFSAAEIMAILTAFRSSRHYCHYADFVAFLFGVGCRFGEGAGLRWEHVSDDFQTVWIGESVSRGHRKGTKTGKARTVLLSPSVGQILRQRRERVKPNPTDLVFPAPKGGAIDDHNFRNRAWKTILEQCRIEYRKPYAARHSAISHALAAGVNPIDLAEQTGHDKRVLLQTYAHAISKQSLFVEF